MDKVINDLNTLDESLQNILYSYKGKRLGSIGLFCIGLLERLNNSVIALKLLIPEYDKKPQLEYSIGIILRSVVLDTLINLNAYQFHKSLLQTKSKVEIEAELTEFINVFLSDGLKQMLDYFKLLSEKNVISQDELTEGHKAIFTKYNVFFKEDYPNDGSRPILYYENKITPLKLFRNIIDDSELSSLGHLYDTYSFFSKYDHFGILYFDLSRQKKQEKDAIISYCVDQFFLHAFILSNLLSEIQGDYSQILTTEIDILKASISSKIKSKN